MPHPKQGRCLTTFITVWEENAIWSDVGAMGKQMRSEQSLRLLANIPASEVRIIFMRGPINEKITGY